MTHARRKQAIVGIVGLAVLGGGAYAATDLMSSDEPAAINGTGALAPAESPATPAPAATSAAPGTTAPKQAAKGATSASPSAKSSKEIIDSLKGSAAKAAKNVERPVTSAKVNPADVTVKRIPLTKGFVEVKSARQDLTGKLEMAWVQGQKGTKVGDAYCSQKVALTAGHTPDRKDNLMLCWRISSTKSVYTLMIDTSGKPSAERSVTELNKVWSSM